MGLSNNNVHNQHFAPIVAEIHRSHSSSCSSPAQLIVCQKMTEIRVGTPGETFESHSFRANIQMQGFAAGPAPGDGGEGLGRLLGPRTRDPGAGANPEATSVKFLSSSVHSEPDLDAIMPLPPAGSYTQHAHHHPPAAPLRNWSGSRARTGSGVQAGSSATARLCTINGDAEDSENSSDEEVDFRANRPLTNSPSSIGFTNVQVSLSVIVCSVT